MQRFVRLISGISFSLGLALSATAHASAAFSVGGTLVEFDQNSNPAVLYAKVRTVIRNLPVRF